MKILVEIPEELFNRIKKVNQSDSISNFILAAIENQIELERETPTDLTKFEIKTKPPNVIAERKEPKKRQLEPEKIEIEILNNPLSYDKIVAPPLKQPIKNYYIWGQYNKFFPLKFALRYLAFMQIKNNSSPVKLTEYQKKCSKAAAMMKSILSESDEQAERKWGEAFSTGLPDDEEKSRLRFNHHFIGYTDLQGNSTGALSDLGFIVIENNLVTLSPSGLEFAKLKNPILDENPLSPTLFSQEERQFLINHVKKSIPLEWQGMMNIIHWIESGLNTPNLLNEKMATLDQKWTDKMTNTYRTGMLARMLDMGFISRKKIGVNANYVVTEFGKKAVGIT